MTSRPTPPQHGDETQLYRDLNHRLKQLVRASVTAPDHVIDDACSHAWLQLLRHQPRRDTVLPWLTKVAVREVWRIMRREARDASLDAMPENSVRRGTAIDLELQLDARDALHTVARLPSRQHRYLALLIAGYSYDEIAAATSASHRTVDRQLARARKALRHHPIH